MTGTACEGGGVTSTGIGGVSGGSETSLISGEKVFSGCWLSNAVPQTEQNPASSEAVLPQLVHVFI